MMPGMDLLRVRPGQVFLGEVGRAQDHWAVFNNAFQVVAPPPPAPQPARRPEPNIRLRDIQWDARANEFVGRDELDNVHRWDLQPGHVVNAPVVERGARIQAAFENRCHVCGWAMHRCTCL